MVNTRTDTDLYAAIQNALQALLPRIHEEIREEFRTGSGSSNAGGNPPPVTIHTSYRRRAFGGRSERLADVASPNSHRDSRGVLYQFWTVGFWWKSSTEFKKLFFLQFFPRAEQERLKKKYHSIRQTDTETSTEFMQRFLQLVGFLGAAAGTAEEQTKNFLRGGGDNHRSNNNYSGNNNRLTLNLFGRHPLINMILTSLYDNMNFGNGHDQRNRGQQLFTLPCTK
nr:hypothetical protein [Tanacetum cinerariifolium]